MDIIGYDGYVIGSIHIMGIQWLLDEEVMAISEWGYKEDIMETYGNMIQR